MPADDPSITDIEDLNPDSAPASSGPDGRELLLGCLLLLIAVGWAGTQWWQQDARERNYRIGQQAEKEYRWTEARASYSAALGYRDAASRVASVTALINELQDNFVSARWHAQEGDWVAALRAVQAVHAIDPNYGDAASLGTEANLHVYREALQGAVAMRPRAQPPGLYYRTENSWIWLKGSDQESSVRSLLSSGVVVYDVPADSRSGNNTQAPVPQLSTYPDSGEGAEWLNSRRMAAASLDGDKLRFTPLAFDPTIYDFYVAGAQGVWAVRMAGTTGEPPAVVQPALRDTLLFPAGGHPGLRDGLSFPAGRELDYQFLGSTVSSTVRLPGPEWAVLNADLGRDRLLLADVKAQRKEGAAIDVYISDAEGGHRRLLYSHYGALGSAQFSPDGRYVLLSTYSSLGDKSTEKLSLVLLGIENSVPPLTLGEKIVDAGAPGSPPLPQMRATFLLNGSLSGMVLVAEWGTERGTLRLFDPATPGSPLVRAAIAGGLAGKAWVNEQKDEAGLVVAWEPWLIGSSAKDNNLLVAELALAKPAQAAVTKTFTFDKETEPVSVVARGDYLICTAYRAAERQGDGEFTLYNLPVSGTGNEQAPATSIYTATMLKGTDPFLSGLAWQLGPTLLSYIDKGQLRARTYDGVLDVRLESGVTGLFNFDWVSPTRLLR